MSNNMRNFRTEADLSMTKLSMMTGISERYLYFIENGEKSPSLKTAKRISEALDRSIEEIFFKN